ncbi:MAG: hypothetical protein S0880_09140 [Actinomycetota bacterium]|nr:hypothetical protein [Actinomycetota bacterium]
MDDVLAGWRRTDRRLRRDVLDVRTWALATGDPVDADALTVIFSVLAAEETTGLDRHHWTEERVLEFIWTGCLFFCIDADLDPPHGIAESLWAWLRYLDSHGLLDPDGDDLRTLGRVLSSTAGLPADDHRRGRSRSIG